MWSHFFVLFWASAACLAPAAGVPASSRTLIDPAPVTPNLQDCSEAEQRCLAAGRLPFALDSRCYEPLSQGPCAEDDFWFVLNRDVSAVSPVLTGACVRRPCAIGEVPHQGRCLAMAEARRELCARGKLHLDPEGRPRCGQQPSWRILLARYVSCNPAPPSSTEMSSATAIAVGVGGVPCSTNDAGECTRIVFTPPTSETIHIEPED